LGEIGASSQWCVAACIVDNRPGYAVLYAATAPSEQVRGRFVRAGHVQRPSRQVDDAGLRQSLWDISCQLAGVDDSEFMV
jgi:hypothetical protein